MQRLAARMGRLGTETAFDCLCRAKELECRMDVVHLEIGEPDFDTPKSICEAAKRAIDEGWTHYGPSAGLPELREAVAEYAGRLRGVRFIPEQVVVTPGAKPVIAFAIMALVEDNDEVIYPNPGFPIYESMIEYMGGRAVPVRLREEDDFRLDVGELARLVNRRTKLIIINSPQNPTGGVLTPEDLKAIAEIALEHDCWVLADEIYSEVIYDTGAPAPEPSGKQGVSSLTAPSARPPAPSAGFASICRVPDINRRLIILDGFSKTWAMTGWRVGYGIMPVMMAEKLARIQTNTNSCTASFTQRACLAALRGPHDEVDAMVAEFKRRRDIIVSGLNEIPGFRCRMPRGAFYAFPNVEGTGIDSKVLAGRLLEEAGVACLDGACFGKYGNGYIRFSYANSVENIERALKKTRGLLAGD